LIIPFFDLFSSFLTLLLLIAYFYLKRESIIKISIIITFISTIFNYQKPFLLGPYHPQNVIIDLFSDLGGLFGISLFLLLLATIGISATWKREKFFINYFFLGFLALLSIYRTSLIIYLNFFIVSLAALGINFLLIREWKIKIIKNLTIFLLLLGIVFSTLSSIDTLSQLNPNIPIKDSLQHMQNETPQYKLIFSHPQDSYLIEYYSDRPAFIHYHDSDFKDREKIVKKALNSTYIEDTFPLFKYNDISHIYISPKTRAELSTEGGLLFLFQNERFKKIYTRNNIEIWEFQ